jgi:hypothetical protein
LWLGVYVSGKTMSVRIKFFKEQTQAKETLEFLNGMNFKSFLRERDKMHAKPGEDPAGYDLFVLRDDDVADARKALDFQFGGEWGTNMSS